MLQDIIKQLNLTSHLIEKDGNVVNRGTIIKISEEIVKDLEIKDLIIDINIGLNMNSKYYTFLDVYETDFNNASQKLFSNKELNKKEFQSIDRALKLAADGYYQSGQITEDIILRAFFRSNVEYNRYRSMFGTGGCYIATSAYGSYEHPQVIKLRYFRDEKLAVSVFGRMFIKVYYFFSPIIVKTLGKSKHFNRIMKKYLDIFISKIDQNSK